MSHVEGSASQETSERREGQQPQGAQDQRREGEGEGRQQPQTQTAQQPQAQQDQRREGEGEGRQQPQAGESQQPQAQQDQRREGEGEGRQQPQPETAQRREGEGQQQPTARQGVPDRTRQGQAPEGVGEQAQRRADQQQVLGAPALPAGDDLLLESPRLKVDELNLELHGSGGIERIDVSTKGVEVEIYMRANLGNALGIVEATRQAPRTGGAGERAAGEAAGQRGRERGESSQGLRDDVQRALESAKSAYERIGAPELRDELQGAFDTFKHAYQQILGDSGDTSQARGSEGQPQQGRQGNSQQHEDEAHQGGGDDVGHDGHSRLSGELAKRVARSQGAAAVAGAMAAFAGSKAHVSTATRRQRMREHLPGRKR